MRTVYWGHGAGVLGGLLWLLIFAAFIGLVAFAVARLVAHPHLNQPPPPPAGPGFGGPVGMGMGPGGYGPAAPAAPWAPPEDEALRAARIRYAQGELDRDAYFRIVQDLGLGAAPGFTGYPAYPGAGAAAPAPAAEEPGTLPPTWPPAGAPGNGDENPA